MPRSLRERLGTGTRQTLAVFLLGAGMSAGGALWRQHAIDLNAENQFQRIVERVSAEISRRFHQPAYGLNGARGLYAASKSVEREEFLAYVESRNLPKEFPGVRGFGFIQHVMRADLDAFIAAERADGAPGFAVRQLTDTTHDDLYVIKLIEPAANNLGAEGLDVGSEANRRSAAQRAVDTGEATITGPIQLVQNSRKTPGVLLYVPVYAKGTRPTSAGARRAALAGLLYAPIVIDELLAGMPDVGPGRVDFEVFDTTTDSPGNALVYDADNHIAALISDNKAMTARRFTTTVSLPLPGREVALRLSSTTGFDATIDRLSPWLTFAAGTLLSALLALLLRQEATGRRRAESIAKRMTEQLRHDEARARDFSTSASDWFWETDAQHRFCYFSVNFEEVYGVNASRLLGKNRKEFLDENALNPPEAIETHFAQLQAHLPFKNFEYQIRASDGSPQWIATSGVPHFDAQGLFAGYRGTGTIITERKRFESELRRQNNTLSALFDNFPGGISLFDENLRLLAHNAQFKQLLEFPDALIESPAVYLEDIIRYNAERGEYGLGDTGQHVAAANARAREFQSHKFERVRPNGTALEISGMPLPDGGFVSIYIDITERRKITQQLEDQKEHLEELVAARTIELSSALEVAKRSDQTKDEFLANMSHELRTPLNAVIGMADLARKLSTDAKQRDYLDKISTSGKHLNRIINDLLDLSKIAAGHVEFETLTFSLRSLVRHDLSVMTQRAEEKNLELTATIDDAVPDVLRGDPSRIEQILLNLMGNAIKFTATGRIDIHVRLDETEEDRVAIAIDVRDTGVGMRPEELDRLFKPFSQADATVSRKFGGTGLGLTISRRLAQMMGGDITVTSREGSGSTFTVRLWLERGASADLPAADSAADETLPGRYKNARVLVADDQPLNREIVEALLEAVGIAPCAAENGQEALDMLSESGPDAFDVVLMDIQMPVMDGHTATRALRGRAGFESLPVIAMTAHTMAHERELCRAAGMSDHIGKPFDNAGFYRTLAKWISADKRITAPAPDILPPVLAPESALSALCGLDVTAGIGRFGGNEEKYRHWLAEFVATAHSVPDTIRTDLAAGDAKKAGKAAHAFKGRVGMLGMMELHPVVSALERALNEGAPADELLLTVDRLIGEMCEQLAGVLDR